MVGQRGRLDDLRRSALVGDDGDQAGAEVFRNRYAEGLIAFGVKGVRTREQELGLFLSLQRADEFQPCSFLGHLAELLAV